MGRDFVTFVEAAELLNCTKRSVHNFVNRGQLRRHLEAGKVLLLRSEVESLAEERGTELPALNNRTLLEILSRLKNLELKVAVFQKMRGIDLPPPVRPTREEAFKLIEQVKYYLQRETFDSAEVDYWVALLSRLDEVSFDLIQRETGQDDFWQHFFNMCILLTDYVSDPKKARKAGNWVRHTLELHEVMKNLRALCLIWVEPGRGRATTALKRHLRTGKDDLVHRLTS